MEAPAEKEIRKKVLVIGGQESVIKADVLHLDIVKARELESKHPFLSPMDCIYLALHLEGVNFLEKMENTPAKIAKAVQNQVAQIVSYPAAEFEKGVLSVGDKTNNLREPTLKDLRQARELATRNKNLGMGLALYHVLRESGEDLIDNLFELPASISVPIEAKMLELIEEEESYIKDFVPSPMTP